LPCRRALSTISAFDVGSRRYPMDSITQGLLGAVVAECGFRDRLGRGAVLLGAVGGVLPDADILLSAVDPWWSWQYHRHFTHSVFFAPLVAVPLAWLFWRARGRRRFGLWFLCAWLAIATHPLLDLCTSYGTEFFVPVSGARLGFDWIAIIDPVYSLILAVALLACLVRWRRNPSAGTVYIGWCGLLLSTAYIGYGAWNQHGALKRLYRSAEARGHHVLAARAIPQLGSVYVWRLIYRTRTGYYVGRTNTLFDGDPNFRHLPFEEHPLIREADRLPRVQRFGHFTMGWARPHVVRMPFGWSVVYDDLRYSWRPDEVRSLWSVVVDFDRDGRVAAVRRIGAGRNGSVGEMLRSVWREIRRP